MVFYIKLLTFDPTHVETSQLIFPTNQLNWFLYNENIGC